MMPYNLDTGIYLRKPLPLKKGDTIGIVAPAGYLDPPDLEAGISFLKSYGFQVTYSASIFNKNWQQAGDDKERAQQINQMFLDKRVKAIFCATGGYGAIRTIPYLDKEVINNHPKIFIGQSDITILLLYLYKTAQMVLFHGPNLIDKIHKDMNPVSLEYLMKVISTDAPLGILSFPSIKTLKPGISSGTLIGGNLSILVNLVGTPYEIDTEGAILFLEDTSEKLETIDNCLMHLKLAGKFDNLKGIIFGKLINDLSTPSQEYNIIDLILDTFSDLEVPIIYGFPSGHIPSSEINITLPLGLNVTLDANKSSLIINESAILNTENFPELFI